MPFPGGEEELTRISAADQGRNERRKRKRKQKMRHYKTGDQVNLRDLLCHKKRDYLINNKGDKISVCDLEDKVVALYFYEEGYTNNLTASLRSAYEQLVYVDNRMFEVVLVYIHDSWNTYGRTDAKSFENTFKTMPWLALPFKDSISSELPFFFRYPFELKDREPDPSLVIIGPQGDYVVPFGASSILLNFGPEAYPFTRGQAYKLQAERIKGMKLEMLWGPKTVFKRKCVSEEVLVPFTDIVGTRILVFCELAFDECYRKFKMKLLERYMETKGGDDEFEVIQIGGLKDEDVPWLRTPSYCGPSPAISRILYHGYGVLAFDHGGKVVRATSYPGFGPEDSNFPFSAGSIEEEVRIDLTYRFEWDDGDRIFLN